MFYKIRNFFRIHFFSIYDFYFWKMVFLNYLMGVLFFIALLSLNQIYILSDYYFIYRFSLSEIMLLFINSLAFICGFSLPFAIMPAYLLTMGQLSSGSEIISFKACGFSSMRLFRPGIFFAILVCIGTFYFKNTIEINGNKNYFNLRKTLLEQRPMVEVGKDTLIRLGDFRLTYKGVDTRDGEDYLKDITISDPGGEQIIFAKFGQLFSNPENPEHYIVKLYVGFIVDDKALIDIENKEDTAVEVTNNNNVAPEGQNPKQYMGQFEYLSMNYYFNIVAGIQGRNASVMNIKEYKESLFIDSVQTSYDHVKNNYKIMLKDLLTLNFKDIKAKIQDNYVYYRRLPGKEIADYLEKIATPLSIIVFAILCLPLGMFNARSGKAEGLGLGVILMLIYYAGSLFFKIIIAKFYLPYFLYWTVFTIYLVVGIILMIKKLKT